MPESYDYIDPSHYKKYPVESIDMMESVFGAEAVIHFCYCSAFKYRMRAGSKPDQPVDRDFNKENWYLAKAKELELKLQNKNNHG
jgi:hypothetical protein